MDSMHLLYTCHSCFQVVKSYLFDFWIITLTIYMLTVGNYSGMLVSWLFVTVSGYQSKQPEHLPCNYLLTLAVQEWHKDDMDVVNLHWSLDGISISTMIIYLLRKWILFTDASSSCCFSVTYKLRANIFLIKRYSCDTSLRQSIILHGTLPGSYSLVIVGIKLG